MKLEKPVQELIQEGARKTLFSIVLFVLVYTLLLIGAVILTGLCVYFGIQLVMLKPGLWSAIGGLAAVSFGALILFFLVKFIFSRSKMDKSLMIELKASDEPKLFKMVYKIAEDLGAPKPKRIYLTQEVNAMVFYESSFWSMFFPVKKNLALGLGLISSVTKEELTSILAHEFGHFSQDSMRTGSYVYQANIAIHNMLYNNIGLEQAMNGLMSMSAWFAIPVMVAGWVIRGIVFVLASLFGYMSKTHSGLSRAMEFEADEVATRYTGVAPLRSSLYRMALAEHSFSEAVGYYERNERSCLKSSNLFDNQVYVLRLMGELHGYEFHGGFPLVGQKESANINYSDIVIKDQWASHPTIEQRIGYLKAMEIPEGVNGTEPAIGLLVNSNGHGIELTNRMFKQVKFKEEPKVVEQKEFEEAYSAHIEMNTYDSTYNDYYDTKEVVFQSEFLPEEVTTRFVDFYSKERVSEVQELFSVKNDLEIVKQIKDKTIPVKTFDYRGDKYSRKRIKEVEDDLNIRKDSLEKLVGNNDARILKYFKIKAEENGLLSQYEFLVKDLLDAEAYERDKLEFLKEMNDSLMFFFENNDSDTFSKKLNELAAMEQKLKKNINELGDRFGLEAILEPSILELFFIYCRKRWVYATQTQLMEDNIEQLFKVVNLYGYALNRASFHKKKKLLDYQVKLEQQEVRSL